MQAYGRILEVIASSAPELCPEVIVLAIVKFCSGVHANDDIGIRSKPELVVTRHAWPIQFDHNGERSLAQRSTFFFNSPRKLWSVHLGAHHLLEIQPSLTLMDDAFI